MLSHARGSARRRCCRRRGLPGAGGIDADEIAIDHRQHEAVAGGPRAALVRTDEAVLDLTRVAAAVAALLVAVVAGLAREAQPVAAHGEALAARALGLGHAVEAAIKGASVGIVAALAALRAAVSTNGAAAGLPRCIAGEGILPTAGSAAAIARLGVPIVAGLRAQEQTVTADRHAALTRQRTRKAGLDRAAVAAATARHGERNREALGV